jgi:hypothetical protein
MSESGMRFGDRGRDMRALLAEAEREAEEALDDHTLNQR